MDGRRAPTALICALALGPLFLAAPARADKTPKVDVSADNAAAAEALFNEGRTLVEKGNYVDACPKFAESQKLDPGSGTLMNLGDCYEKVGKFASAWATYREAISESNKVGNQKRERDAKVLADRVEPKLSFLKIEVPKGSLLPSLQIKRDDFVVDRAQWGTYIPTDSGSHRISAEAPGHKPWTMRIDIAQSTRRDLEVPPLEVAPEAALEDRGKKQRTLGLVVGGVGVLGLAAGGVLGLMAMSSRATARDLGCTDVDCPTQAAKDKNDSALGAANISTVLFIAGGVVTAAGAVILLTAPKAPSAATTAAAAARPSLAAGVRGTRVVFEGTF